MKLRRLLALLLVLVLTAAPIVNATSGEGNPIAPSADPEYQTISAVDTSLVVQLATVNYNHHFWLLTEDEKCRKI